MTQTGPKSKVGWWKFTSMAFVTEASTDKLYVSFDTGGGVEWVEPVLDYEPGSHC